MAVKAHAMLVARDPSTGAVLLSATINVYNPGTVTPISATIYDKNNNVLSNPLTSDATTGLIDFYLTVAQEVDLVVAKAGYTTRTYSNVPVLDDASLDLSALLTTTGDMVYASAANTPARLPIGSVNAVFVSSGGVPTWTTAVQINPSGNTALDTTGTTLSGNTVQAAILGRATGNSSATTEISGLYSAPATANSSFTCTDLIGIHATANTKGAAATVTNSTGVKVDAQSATCTNSIGVDIAAPSGGSGLNLALRAAGDAVFGTTGIANGATTGFLFVPQGGGTPTGVPAYTGGHIPIRFNTADNKLYAYINGTWKASGAFA